MILKSDKKRLEEIIKKINPAKGSFKNNGNIKINCPNCENVLHFPKNKFNLEVNISKGYHCWACNDKGGVLKLIRKYSSREDIEDAIRILGNDNSGIEYDKDKGHGIHNNNISLPNRLVEFSNTEDKSYQYLISRGVTVPIIKQRGILQSEDKKTIYFPSYNMNGVLDGYVEHQYGIGKYKQRKSSEQLFFDSKNINFLSVITITEGVYDGYILPNSIIINGDMMSRKQIDSLHNKNIILALDNEINISKLKRELILNDNRVVKLNLNKYEDVNKMFQKNRKLLYNNLRSAVKNLI